MSENSKKDDFGAVPKSKNKLSSLKDYIEANPGSEETEQIKSLKFQRFWLFVRLILLIPALSFGSLTIIVFISMGDGVFTGMLSAFVMIFPFLGLPAFIMLIKKFGFWSALQLMTNPFKWKYVTVETDSWGSKRTTATSENILITLLLKLFLAIIFGIILLFVGSIYGLYRNVVDVFAYNKETKSLGIESPIYKNFWGLWIANGIFVTLFLVIYLVSTTLEAKKAAEFLEAATVTDNQEKIEVLTALGDSFATDEYVYTYDPIRENNYGDPAPFIQYDEDGNSYLAFNGSEVEDFGLFGETFYLSRQGGVDYLFIEETFSPGFYSRYTENTAPDSFAALENYKITALCKFDTLIENIDSVEIINPYEHEEGDWALGYRYGGDITLEFPLDDVTHGKISISTTPRESDSGYVPNWDERRIYSFKYYENDKTIYTVYIRNLRPIKDQLIKRKILAPNLLNSEMDD